MAQPRRRFCPRGHDKDLPNGSYWSTDHTLKGTPTRQRQCAECHKLAADAQRIARRACIHCHKAPAEVPDRNTMSRRRRVCKACHAALLRADLRATIGALQEREKSRLANLNDASADFWANAAARSTR